MLASFAWLVYSALTCHLPLRATILLVKKSCGQWPDEHMESMEEDLRELHMLVTVYGTFAQLKILVGILLELRTGCGRINFGVQVRAW
jgi:hypothetical protein